MAKQVTRSGISSSELSDENSTSSSETESQQQQQRRPQDGLKKKDSIRHYVTNVLHRHGGDDEQQPDIQIDTRTGSRRPYENISAFRQYHSHAEGTARTDAQQRFNQSSTSDEDDLRQGSSTDQSGFTERSPLELNLDPNPIIEERESAEQIYKQKVYLRQLQPPTPQPVEIQVQEVLLPSQGQKPPIHVRVGQREPRTPSPIVIKSTPPQPPSAESEQPIVYNKYVPPPKQPPQQIVIHRYPDMPPKPRPIVVEQWLPYKPAPKRIIKHSLPPEALQTPPPPHNLLVSYAKPRALIEVELIRLPIVKIDPQTYQQMSAINPQQDYLSSNLHSTQIPPTSSQLDWRI